MSFIRMYSLWLAWVSGAALALAPGSGVAGEPAGGVDFARDVRPLFTTHCTACHGGVKQAGGLSFISRDQALAEADSGSAAIVPGDPEGSELLRRVASTDEAERMPPPEHGRGLSAEEIDVLRAWIAAGAEWQAHQVERHPAKPLSRPGRRRRSQALGGQPRCHEAIEARLSPG